MLAIVALIIVGGASYYAGTKHTSASVPARGQFTRGGTTTGGRGGFGGGGLSIGQVLSSDAQSITIKLSNGGSQIIFTGASTTISKMTPGSMEDLAPGTNVMVQGTPNSDGSVNARSIQIRQNLPSTN